MNELGWILLGAVVQVTLLSLISIALYAVAVRRGSGTAVAVACLAGSVLLTILAFCPLPNWWTWTAANPTQAAAPNIDEISSPGEIEGTVAKSERPPGGLSLPDWLFRGFGSRPSHTAIPPETTTIHWPALFAVVLISGASVALIRLMLGLWSLRRYRQSGRAIDDSNLLALAASLQNAIGCHGEVALRECPDLGAPATIGWYHPVILLPLEWREWSELECRAVLAHELAHVQRRDYLAGLLACFTVAIHFYHPLVRWLANRLRLQQELAADEWGARLAGGRANYLVALAKLALRQDGRQLSWPASSFFSNPGTLLRRIAMLRAKEGVRPVSRWIKGFAVSLSITAALGLSAVRSPAQKADVKESANVAATAADKEPAAFDMSYVPESAMWVYAVRPEILARPENKHIAKKINDLCAVALKALKMPAYAFPPAEEFEQIISHLTIVTLKTDPTSKGPQTALRTDLNMVRCTHDFDWIKGMKEWFPDSTELKHGNKIYYKVTKTKAAMMRGFAGQCYYAPDSRTLVVGTEAEIANAIDGKTRKTPPPWAKDWTRMQHGSMALIIDYTSGALAQEMGRRMKPSNFMPFNDDVLWQAMGADWRGTLQGNLTIQCKTDAAATKVAKIIEEAIEKAKAEDTKKEAPAKSDAPDIFEDMILSLAKERGMAITAKNERATLEVKSKLLFYSVADLVLSKIGEEEKK